MPFDTIAFDADDTLWHTEHIFSMTQEKFAGLLAEYHDAAWIQQRLFETEMRNLRQFGYGIKGFTLSMIETAIELTEGRISGEEIGVIIDFAREMLQAPVELLDGAQEVVTELAATHRLMLITKGDLIDQETKIARSGLAEHFAHIEIVSDKSAEIYRQLLVRHAIAPSQFLMVGNSVRSDVLPVRAIGGHAVHIPYRITWAHEHADADPAEHDYAKLTDIRQLPEWIARHEA
jgi:putative hydrolase of the HAD superfamily